MDSMTLFIASLAVSCIGALASVLLIKADNAAKTAGCLIGAVAAVLSFVAGIQAVLGDVTSVDTIVFFPFAHFQLLLNQLSGLFVALISVLAFAGSIYGLNYFDEYPGKKGRAGFFFNTFVASMMLVITGDNVFWFLVAFELMSLTSYFLVVIEENENSIHGGWLYFVIAHVGFVLIMASFLTMTNFAGGSFAFADFRATQFSPAVASVCFVLAFFGFGAKAGIIPLHGWLPKAHPEAPSNVSALMSGGMIKIGIFGILKVGLDLLSASGVQVWWGLMVMVFGAISSVLGVAFALQEHDIKRLLAYHSVENIGIILLGVGASMAAMALNSVGIAVLALMAALYHTFNHAMFKGELFLGAGALLYSTGTRNMEKMGGLFRRMPATAICFLIGGICAGITGVLLSSYVYAGAVSYGDGLNITLISASVLGGVKFTGGKGSVIRTLLGIVVVRAIINIASLLSFDAWAQNVLTGALLLAVLIVDRCTREQRLEDAV